MGKKKVYHFLSSRYLNHCMFIDDSKSLLMHLQLKSHHTGLKKKREAAGSVRNVRYFFLFFFFLFSILFSLSSHVREEFCMYFLNADNFGKDNRGGACCYYGEWAHLLNLAGAQANRILEGLVVF